MTNAAKSVFYFGFYVLLIGVFLLAIPQTFLSALKLPVIPDGWSRIIGLLAVIIGVYDVVSGKNNLLPAIKASVYLRFFFFLGVLLLIVSDQMPKEALPLGLIDAAGAIWTLLALRSNK
jgi:hypothetical protein